MTARGLLRASPRGDAARERGRMTPNDSVGTLECGIGVRETLGPDGARRQ